MRVRDLCKIIDAANRMFCSIIGEQVSFEFDTWSEQGKKWHYRFVRVASTPSS